MTKSVRAILTIAALVSAATVPQLGYASGDGGASFHDMVGTHIYSPGPMAPATPFRLEMQLTAPAMKAIHVDMMMHPSVAGTATIACTMQAAPHHRGMVILTCTPGA